MGSFVVALPSSSILLIFQLVQTCHLDQVPCRESLAIPLAKEKILEYENGSLLHEGVLYPVERYWKHSDKLRGCICDLRACLRKCCKDDEALYATNKDNSSYECRRSEEERSGALPDLRAKNEQLAPEMQNIRRMSDRFALVHNKMCPNGTYALDPEKFKEEKFVVQADGTLRMKSTILPQWLYCMDWHESLEKIIILVCWQPDVQLVQVENIFPIGMVVSIPFLLVTFLVYALIPELRNIYGKTLMCYVGCLVIAYCVTAIAGITYFAPFICISMALVIHFSFLASFFWLNVMCFDIWWTFGGFRTLRGSVKQREQKKFIMYSMYAWGSASVLSAVCIIMDFVPNIPKSFIRPMFGQDRCWFNNDEARAIYFYGPMGITVFCNICLFVSTALKISRHKKDTAHHLKGSESRRHDDNKQWFNLYLKLFIVMGINWSMEIVSWLFDGSLAYVWYITDLANTLQGLIIFVIFVWKEKTKRLLLKRFGCHRTNNFLSRNSTRSAYNSSTSRTYTSSVGTSLQEKANHYPKRTRSDLFTATANPKEPDNA